NAQALAQVLQEGGLGIISGGTDCHLILVDLRPKGVTGKAAEIALERAGLTCNKNSIPNDPEKPFVTSGIRLGTPAGTTRGFGKAELEKIGHLILRVLDALSKNPEGDAAVEAEVRKEVRAVCDAFPIYGGSSQGRPGASKQGAFDRSPLAARSTAPFVFLISQQPTAPAARPGPRAPPGGRHRRRSGGGRKCRRRR